MVGTLQEWQWLSTEPAKAMLDTLAGLATPAAGDIERLRKKWPRETVAAAVELTLARRKAMAKFTRADELLADVEGVEQASSEVVAEHKARRFKEMGARTIVDLCCGIGGDAMSLARVGRVLGVDRSDVRAWMTGMNAQCETVCGDIAESEWSGDAIHLDPARRIDGRRIMRWKDYQPSPEVLLSVLARHSNTAMKLGPGIDPREVPIGETDELEFISERGGLVQCVWWRGGLVKHPGERTATMLPSGETLSGIFCAESGGDGGIGRFIHIADPSIERAGLLHRVAEMTGSQSVYPGLGWLTSDGQSRSAWTTTFEVCALMPWRVERVKSWLELNGAGWVEIKCRGVDVDTDRLQRTFHGKGVERFVVLVFRRGRVVDAAIAKRANSEFAAS
jgi:hypothetical protein